MNTSLRWKLAVGLLLAFVAGVAFGGFLAGNHARHLRADFAHPHRWLVERIRSRMEARLDLTPEQIEKTAPIFDHAASELEKVRGEAGERVQQIMAETDRALAPDLTEAQRTKLDAVEKRPRSGRILRNAPGNRAQPPSG